LRLQVSDTQFLFEIAGANTINHLCVFMTGVAPLPPDMAAGIYLSWPDYSRWTFLGYISNDKPSAIFRIGGTAPTLSPAPQPPSSPFVTLMQSDDDDSASMMLGGGGGGGNGGGGSDVIEAESSTARLGLSIEPLASVLQQQQQSSSSSSSSISISRGSFPSATTSSSSLLPLTATPSIPRSVGEELISKASLKLLRHFYNYAMSFASGGFISVDALHRWASSLASKLQYDPTYLTRDSDD